MTRRVIRVTKVCVEESLKKEKKSGKLLNIAELKV